MMPICSLSCDWHVLQVEAANREVAGVEAGDGRDESNRSLAERLADAHNTQVLSGSSLIHGEVSSLIHGVVLLHEVRGQ